eukprot:CAMPEP_0183595608 /NCGR_PEP_ID=MMETSP0371-20130417/173667_1 /TAXON_ID=268820 /ORGANISM="Peridinium aciculiferum, Strain PAER-2" /LENGTH=33 /DNA_ID= /DNA_START= /DNA_END= /DNA_ORIENTATION=
MVEATRRKIKAEAAKRTEGRQRKRLVAAADWTL